MVKTLPAGMQTDLDTGVTTLCFCWKLTRTDATVMGFTDHDKDLTFDSVTYNAATGLNASAISGSTNLNVDDMDTIGALDSAAITEADILKGKYDNAEVVVFRVDHSDVTKRVEVFRGYLGGVSRGQNDFKAEVRSIAHLLNQATGQVYQKTCNVDLFSSKCGVLIGADPDYQRTAIGVDVVYSRRIIGITDAAIIALDSSWYTGGLLTWTTGNNTGIASEIKTHVKQSGGAEAWIDLWEAMPEEIQVGDECTLQVGCDKTIETCKAKFNNVINFRGFPRMPGTDAVITYASKADKNDGSSWYQ